MNIVYIIIVNWNGWKDTVECLESLLKLQYPCFRVVICDNGSQDHSCDMFIEWCETKSGLEVKDWQVIDRITAENGDGFQDAIITFITNDANLGFGGGTNVGLRYAMSCGDAVFCWLLNNDTVVDPLALSELVIRLNEKPDASMCGSTIRDYANRAQVQALGGAIYYKWLGVAWHIGRRVKGYQLPEVTSVENRMDYITAASLLVRISYLTEVGLLAEDYFLYFEEIDWITRGFGRYSLAYAPKSLVYHKVGASIGTATNPLHKSYTCDYYSLRNRILYSRRHCPAVLPCIYLGLFAEFFVRLMLGRWDLARMILRLLWNGVDEIKTS